MLVFVCLWVGSGSGGLENDVLFEVGVIECAFFEDDAVTDDDVLDVVVLEGGKRE